MKMMSSPVVSDSVLVLDDDQAILGLLPDSLSSLVMSHGMNAVMREETAW